jgi:hypothetical protein
LPVPTFARDRPTYQLPFWHRLNGKAERFIQTSLREWAYACAYNTSALAPVAVARNANPRHPSVCRRKTDTFPLPESDIDPISFVVEEQFVSIRRRAGGERKALGSMACYASSAVGKFAPASRTGHVTKVRGASGALFTFQPCLGVFATLRSAGQTCGRGVVYSVQLFQNRRELVTMEERNTRYRLIVF